MSSKKSLFKSKKIVLGIAVALGCSLVSSVSFAASNNTNMFKKNFFGHYVDVNEKINSAVGESYDNPHTYTYRMDGTKVQGGNVIVTNKVKDNYIFGNMKVNSTDLTATSTSSIFNQLKDKYKFDNDVTYNYRYGYMTMSILDRDNDIARHATIDISNVNNKNHIDGFSIDGGTWKQVLVNDGSADQYDIKQATTTVNGGTIPANTLMWNKSTSIVDYNITPDLTNENIKAAVKGAEKDLYVTNQLGASTVSNTVNINATGSSNDVVYGIYNNQKGVVSIQADELNITASGNSNSNAIYAGGGSETSKVIYASTNSGNSGTVLASGDVVVADNNGMVDIDAVQTTYKSDNGNIFVATNGGRINVGKLKINTSKEGYTTKTGTVGINATVADGKYLAVATNDSNINLGVDIEHLSDVGYDNATVFSSQNDVKGNLLTDSSSKINLGVQGLKTYTGNAKGNIGIYLRDGAKWTGTALDNGITVDSGYDTTWDFTETTLNQRVKSLNASDSAYRRSYVHMGSGNLTIDKYAGNTTFFYQHNAGSPIMDGGTITITSATPKTILSQEIYDEEIGESKHNVLSTVPSSITLAAQRNNISDADVNAALDNLAAKLYYNAYTTGERNLSGRVELTEGLTSQSVAKNFSNLTFNETTGQAQRENKVYNAFTNVIFGLINDDGYQSITSENPETKKLEYTFNDNAIINVKLNENSPKIPANSALYCAAINNWGDKPYESTADKTANGPSYTMDMQGHNLDVNFGAYPTPRTTGSQPMWTAAAIAAYREGTIVIDNPGAITINSSNNYYYGSAIRATTAGTSNTGAHVFINNDNSEEHAVKIRGGIPTPGYEMNWQAVYAMSQNGSTKDGSNTVKINGLVDIETNKATALYAKGAYSKVSVGGGKISSANYDAIWSVGANASVNVNMLEDAEGNVTGARNNKVQIVGNAASTTKWYGGQGIINLGLTTDDSYIKGHIYGNGTNNLYLQNGASWINAVNGYNQWSTGQVTTNSIASLVTNLHGGNSSVAAGNIFQKEAAGLTIGNLDGHINVFMAHNSDNSFDNIGNVTIGKASKLDGENAVVNMITDNSNIDMTNTAAVNDTLNNLANKLFYTSYVDGERNLDGYVKITEGLTASSVTKALGNIVFNNSNGQGALASTVPQRAASMRMSRMNKTSIESFDAEKEYKNYTSPILGFLGEDGGEDYIDVIDETNHSYNFNNNVGIDYQSNDDVQFAILSIGNSPQNEDMPLYSTNINMNNHDLKLNVTGDDNNTAGGLAAITATEELGRGLLEIYNPGNIEIYLKADYNDLTSGILANNGATVHVYNGEGDLNKKIVKIRAENNNNPQYGAAICGINLNVDENDNNFSDDTPAKIIIDGLVDIEVNGTKAATGILACASNIDIGGGKIIALDGANAIWAGGYQGFEESDQEFSKQKSTVNVNITKDDNGLVSGAGSNMLQLQGNIVTEAPTIVDTEDVHIIKDTNGQINLGFNGKDSYFHGDYVTATTTEVKPDELADTGVNIFLNNGADWTGTTAGATTLTVNNGSTWHGSGTTEQLAMKLDTGSVWYNNGTTKVRYLTGGDSEANRGVIDMTGENSGNITIDNYSGNTMVLYSHDESAPSNINGGDISINNATEGSAITLSTDNVGIDIHDTEQVENVLDKMARKLTYLGAQQGLTNLTGKVQIAEGLTAASASQKVGDMQFSADNGLGSLVSGSVRPEEIKDPEVLYGPKETAMMKGAKSAMASTAMMWRAENNDLMKRMGDLRLSEGEKGLWAKYYGGKYEMDNQNTDFNLKYNAYQLGYDVDAGNGWTVGAAVSYNDGDATYGNGRGDLSTYSAGIYGTWKSEDGQYVDIIAKYSKLENDYKVFNDSGHKLSGDYKTWGTSISAEYGKRFENDNGFYFDPSVELTLGRINGKDYNAHSDYLDSVGVKKDLEVQQDAFNTLVGRVGFRLGQKLDNASYFVKLAAAHEFSGEFDSTFRAVNEPEGKTSIDFGDTWYEAQIGGTVKLSDNSLIYADFERSFGGDVEEKWRVDAGLRFTF